MPKKILIIDNDLDQIEFFKNGLISHNYRVFTNPYGINIFSQIEQEKPDLVLLSILDIGEEVVEFVKSNTVPFICICGSDDLSVLEDIYTLGPLGVLIKPININQLTIEIETALHFYQEKIRLNRRKDNINITIENNRKISLALGLAMERYKINGEDAFEIIRNVARNEQNRVLDIAEKLVFEHEKTLTTLLAKSTLNLDKTDLTEKNSSAYILNQISQTIKDTV